MATVRDRLASLRAFDVLALTSGIWFLSKFVRYALPPLFETFRGAYGVSNATLGLLFSILMLAYGAMQFPSGAIADRIGAVRVIAVGTLVLSGAALLLFATQAFAALVAAVVLIGLGGGVQKTVGITLLAAAYPARTGRTLGVGTAAGELAGVAAPAAVVFVLGTAVGWPGLFLASGAVGVALAIAFAVRAPRRLSADALAEAGGGRAAGAREYLSVLRRPQVAGFVLAAVVYSFAFNGVVAFLPLFLTSAKGLTQTRAGLLYGALFAVSVVQPATGALSDRIGRFPVMVAALGLAAASLGLLVGATGLLAVALVPLLGVGAHGFRPVRDSHLMDVIPPEASGGVLGIARTAMVIVGAASPAVVGLLSDAATFTVAFVALAVAFGAGAATVVALAATAD